MSDEDEHEPMWFFDAGYGFCECDRPGSDSAVYEAKFQESTKSKTPKVDLQVGNVIYTLDFSCLDYMTQTNTQYRTTRQIQRLPEPIYGPLNPKPVKLTPQQLAKQLLQDQQKIQEDLLKKLVQTQISSFSTITDISRRTELTSYLKHVDTRANSKGLALLPTLGKNIHPIFTTLSQTLQQLPTSYQSFQNISINTIPLNQFPTAKDFFSYAVPIMTEEHYKAWRLAQHNGTQSSFPYSTFISNSGPTKALHQPTALEISNGHGNDSDIDCYICLTRAWDSSTHPQFPTSGDDAVVQLPCRHIIHSGCLRDQLDSSGACGQCKQTIIYAPGPQPCGTCTIQYSPSITCAGSQAPGAVIMQFSLNGGVQDSRHSNPGRRYGGDRRIHYMPATPYVLHILLPLYVKAWMLRHLFTVGTSYARNTDGVITYSSIHLKSAPSGQMHAFPDPQFESTATGEITDAGIKLYTEDFGL